MTNKQNVLRHISGFYNCIQRDRNTAMQLLDRLVNYSRILQCIILNETSFGM